jgi:hypothetical protein
MDDQEFDGAVKRLNEHNAHIKTLIERMPPLTEAQKQRVVEILARHRREHDECLKSRVGIKTRADSVRGAWEAAQRAIQDTDSEYSNTSQRGNWHVMGIALALLGLILLCLKFITW